MISMPEEVVSAYHPTTFALSKKLLRGLEYIDIILNITLGYHLKVVFYL